MSVEVKINTWQGKFWPMHRFMDATNISAGAYISSWIFFQGEFWHRICEMRPHPVTRVVAAVRNKQCGTVFGVQVLL